MASICLAAFDVQHSEHCKLFPPRAQWACVYEAYSKYGDRRKLNWNFKKQFITRND
jgi:hypothetical protein